MDTTLPSFTIQECVDEGKPTPRESRQWHNAHLALLRHIMRNLGPTYFVDEALKRRVAEFGGNDADAFVESVPS